jgi:hypothetical protein
VSAAVLRILAGCSVAVALALSGCTGDGSTPDSNLPTYTAEMLQAGVLQPTDVGSTWKRPEQSPPTTSVIALCPGLATRPPIPGKPSVIAASMADEGEKGAQAFDQQALLYPDAGSAEAAFASLQATMAACPASASRTAGPRENSAEAGYTENITIDPLISGEWKGFVVLRHKVYEPTNPGTADTAVAVVGRGNAIVIASYAVYWIGQRSTGPEFTADWRRMIGTVLSRVDAKRGAS